MKIYTSESEVWPDAAEALEKALSHLPGARVATTLSSLLLEGKRPDILAVLTYAKHHVTFLGEVKKIGEPQYAHAALRQLNEYRQIKPDAECVFIAPYISSETALLCRRENINYLDLSGNCHFAFNGIYIHVEGKPNLSIRPRPLRSLYQPKAERVLRVLLTHPSEPWRIQALADAADVSIGQTYKVKELLLEREWLEETVRGISLTKPKELLAAWAEHYRFSKHQAAQFHTLSNMTDFEQVLSIGCRQRGIPCAFTSLAAATRYAPYATYRRTTAYLHHERAEVQELLSLPPLQLSPVQTGANVTLLSPYDEGVFYRARQLQNVTLASPIQTYLDLQHTGTRGLEAAEVLLQTEIIPNW